MKPRIDFTRVSPRALQAMLGLQTYVNNSGLEHNLLELVKMRASQINGCAYCLDMHTKDALAAAKARGVKLGNPAQAKAMADAAAARDAALRDTLASMAGLSSRAIAQRLTELGIVPPRGGAWSQKTVLRMLLRLGMS